MPHNIFIYFLFFLSHLFFPQFFIRSTKSEKMYPSMLSRGPDIETEPYYCLPVNAQGMVPWSQPTSPQPTPSRGFTGLLSPTHNTSHRLTYPKKNDEGNFHGNALCVCLTLMKFFLIFLPFLFRHHYFLFSST